MSTTYSNQEIRDGLLHQDESMLMYMYNQYLPAVIKLVTNEGGERDDALDVFQDGIMALYSNIRKGKYVINENTKISTYFLQICKFRWYDVKKSARYRTTDTITDEVKNTMGSDVQPDFEEVDRYQGLHKIIESLGDQCKEILKRFYWEKQKMDEIASALNMTAASLKNGKYRCMQRLKSKAGEMNLINILQ
jgi:RNA polymerase sigma factor (sigma-70 family)